MTRKKTSVEKSTPQTLRERAEALVSAKSLQVQTLQTSDVEALVHELNVHQVELKIQNEELREAQMELIQSRDRYSELYDFAPVGYITLDTDGRILEANLTAVTMLGICRYPFRSVALGVAVPQFQRLVAVKHPLAVVLNNRVRNAGLTGSRYRWS